ncbi:MAG: FtsX-like permease family protein [Bacteroidetes bacterium]|nr:FtsX-like permease family protein [Bacteroidota bacterium]
MRTYTGYIQIHGIGYWEERSLEKSIDADSVFVSTIEKMENVEIAVPRLENFMLVSSKEITKVGSVVCIDPEKENAMTRLKNKIISGRYINHNDKGILIAEGLAKMLNVGVEDTVVLYGQGIYGTTAAALVPIIGIVKFALPDLNNSFMYMPITYGQDLFSMQGKLTTLSIMINNPRKLDKVYEVLKETTKGKYEVMRWEDMMPELVQGIFLDNVGGVIMIGILYLIIAFGIFGTVMMMTAERTKEFGVLISIGMKKTVLVLVTTIEAIFISFLGAMSGLICSIPLIIYFNRNPIQFTGEIAEVSLKFGVEPIIPLSTDVTIFIAQTLVVLAIAIFSALYPVNYIRKLKPVKAMRA